MNKVSFPVVAALALLSAGPAVATVVYTGSGTAAGNPVSASAQFTFNRDLLTIFLSNTSPSHSGQDTPGSTLTGLFFDLTGDPLLSSDSATVSSGSSIIQASTCSPGPCLGVTNVGGEFGYQHDGSRFPNGAGEGIASAGYATTGFSQNIGNFNGNNLDDPASLDGINFGLVSSASGFTPNGGKNGKGGLKYDPLIQDSVTFVLDNVKGLAVSDISNVSFQYGTNISEGNIPGMPPSVSVSEPPSGYVFGLGALLLLFRFWIRKRNGADDVSESDDRLSDRGARKTSVFLQRSI
ncbi:MAG: hypothetical protein PF501_00670 [Salinisphaera sp.]|jgi:hypothetical protein|nr:hypothetical protein [Salinisphaera sp.]